MEYATKYLSIFLITLFSQIGVTLAIDDHELAGRIIVAISVTLAVLFGCVIEVLGLL